MSLVSIWFIAKIFVVFGLILYVIFAFVITRQVRLMLDTLEVNFEKPISILSYVHLGFAVFVLLLAVVLL